MLQKQQQQQQNASSLFWPICRGSVQILPSSQCWGYKDSLAATPVTCLLIDSMSNPEFATRTPESGFSFVLVGLGFWGFTTRSGGGGYNSVLILSQRYYALRGGWEVAEEHEAKELFRITHWIEPATAVVPFYGYWHSSLITAFCVQSSADR